MKILILSDESSWFKEHIDRLRSELLTEFSSKISDISIVGNHKDITGEGYDINIMLSYSKIVKKEFLDLFKHNLVVHASDLPKGKGMSPLTWQILEGKNRIPFCLFEAREALDAGPIYIKDYMEYNGSELVEELRNGQVEMTFRLVKSFFEKYPDIYPIEQAGEETVYDRRRPADGEMDPAKTLEELFNHLRISDNEKYPAFFMHKGQKYILKIYKDDNE